MAQRRSAEKRASAAKQKSVFLNLPYDHSFQNLFVLYRRNQRTWTHSKSNVRDPWKHSPAGSHSFAYPVLPVFHSFLSRVQLDRHPPATPRFNMPFELGLTVGSKSHRSADAHVWFVFERVPWRLQKSLSDLNGTDVYTHGGTPEGVFRTLLSAFVRQRSQPTVGQMNVIYENRRSNLRPILRDTGASSPFEASVFKLLSVYASALADEVVAS